MRVGQTFMQLAMGCVVIVGYSIIVDGVGRECLSHAVVCDVTGVECPYVCVMLWSPGGDSLPAGSWC